MPRWRWFFFFFLFTMDIRVRAAESCFNRAMPCVIEGRQEIEAKDLQVVVGRNSLVVQSEKSLLQLVRGHVYVEAQADTRVRTPFATAWCEGACTGILERAPRHVVIMSLSGSWRLQRTGEVTTYQVAVGSRVKVSEVTPEGVAGMDFPQALPFVETVRLWGSLFPGNVEELRVRVAEFQPRWMEVVEKLSEANQQAARRSIANWNKVQAEEQARRLATKREDEELRRLFREKNYLSP